MQSLRLSPSASELVRSTCRPLARPGLLLPEGVPSLRRLEPRGTCCGVRAGEEVALRLQPLQLDVAAVDASHMSHLHAEAGGTSVVCHAQPVHVHASASMAPHAPLCCYLCRALDAVMCTWIQKLCCPYRGPVLDALSPQATERRAHGSHVPLVQAQALHSGRSAIHAAARWHS